jgi:hypothetical protein
MVRRSVLEGSDLRFRTGRKGVEDWDLWLRLSAASGADYVEDPLVSYRLHEPRTSTDGDGMYRGHMTTLDDLEEWIRLEPGFSERKSLLDLCRKRRALECLHYGHWLLSERRREEASAAMRKAARLSPLDPHCWWGLVKAFAGARS